jgi:nitrate reductase gamma subunit
LASGATPVLEGGRKDLGAHRGLDCGRCHHGAAAFPHDAQRLGDCRDCHAPHDEKAAGGDAHLRVDCRACHFAALRPTMVEGRVSVLPAEPADQPRSFHELAAFDDRKSCRRCHHAGNSLGAAAMVLPGKGVLCLPCHRATFAWGGWPSRIGLAVFILGMLLAAGVWLRGRGGPIYADHRHPGADRSAAGRALSALFWDGLLQRRLWRHSPARGLIHNLIFLPFLLRFLYGLAGLLASLWRPEWSLAQVLVDKNHPVTALFFELTGLMVLAGAFLALARRLYGRGRNLPGLPRPDWPAIGLLCGVVVSGFVVEAVRIAMTGFPAGAGWAFVGWLLAGALPAGSGAGAYGYLWYAHAALWAAFAAYLPFSRMLHMAIAPVTLAWRAAKE